MTKPTPRQIEVMRFLARSYPYACLLNELDQFSQQHPEVITAQRHVPAIRALYRKGWAAPYRNWGHWASVMTEEGARVFQVATASE
ncbi:hypothetical protein GZ982_30135 (plasmid) [Pseudomonas fluorescens]|nr:hypothetical protein GZ982_30135 [Pseudomonas fluorescens]